MFSKEDVRVQARPTFEVGQRRDGVGIQGIADFFAVMVGPARAVGD
jgi:hypothetical protein